MAHNLMKTEKGYAYAGAKQLAWHRLGVTTKDVMTAKEAIELAQLDYNVGISPVYANINGVIREATDNKVTFNERSGEEFGVVGSRYEIIQNLEAFTFLDNIVGEGNAAYHTAGALNIGETIFITVKLPQNIRLASAPNEQIENYLLFTSSHDGSGSIRVMFTPIRVVCNNTLDAALNGISKFNSWSIKHTKNAKNRMASIVNLFENVKDYVERLSFKFDKMNTTLLGRTQIESIIARIVLSDDEYILEGVEQKVNLLYDISTRKRNVIRELNTAIYRGVGQDIINVDTAYGVYNGVTTYLQNHKKYKNDTDKFNMLYSKTNYGDKAMKILDTYML